MTNSDLSTAIDLKHELDRIAMIASCIRFVTPGSTTCSGASGCVASRGANGRRSTGFSRSSKKGASTELEGFRPAPFVLITGLRLYRTVYRSENTLVFP